MLTESAATQRHLFYGIIILLWSTLFTCAIFGIARAEASPADAVPAPAGADSITDMTGTPAGTGNIANMANASAGTHSDTDMTGAPAAADSSTALPSAIVTTDLYVRSGPSAGHDALAIAHAGDTVPILEMPGGTWVRIQVQKDGQPVEGYVNSRYLQMPASDSQNYQGESALDVTEDDSQNASDIDHQDISTESPADVSADTPNDSYAGSPGQYLWIGDSRVQGMYLYTHQDVYCAAESADLKWLKGEGHSLVTQALAHFTRPTVLLSLGINDPDNAEGYISSFRRLIRQFPEKDFFIMSVGPVNEATEAANGYTVKNAMIEEMNAHFAAAFPDHYLDIYHWLRRTGFGSNDGVHYTPGSCRALGIYVHLAVPLLKLRNILMHG